ncbi:curli production assembly protein CsgF [Thalassomonas haliotis]|uniref:Curli production assembly/transport component CsgF n=2 Tax=Thalassomonas haliotis TaxID=485448 RepID=A0ABY7VLI9_9GAMM|nr:curli production assembly protein CsgF [Thalassomonas haliotis]
MLVNLLLALPVLATEMVYQPINPSFGGNPMNGSYLLNKAQAQNKHKASVDDKSYADKFQESLERSYINQMVRKITDEAFGETNGAFDEDAIFTSGDYEILVMGSNTDTIIVQISNSATGEVTMIEVPRYPDTGNTDDGVGLP